MLWMYADNAVSPQTSAHLFEIHPASAYSEAR
jgi:hypothetical protein